MVCGTHPDIEDFRCVTRILLLIAGIESNPGPKRGDRSGIENNCMHCNTSARTVEYLLEEIDNKNKEIKDLAYANARLMVEREAIRFRKMKATEKFKAEKRNNEREEHVHLHRGRAQSSQHPDGSTSDSSSGSDDPTPEEFNNSSSCDMSFGQTSSYSQGAKEEHVHLHRGRAQSSQHPGGSTSDSSSGSDDPTPEEFNNSSSCDMSFGQTSSYSQGLKKGEKAAKKTHKTEEECPLR